MLSTRISCELEVYIYNLLLVFQIEVPRQRSLELALSEAKQDGKPGLLPCKSGIWLLLCQKRIRHEVNEV